MQLFDLLVTDLLFGEGRLGGAFAITHASPELANDHPSSDEVSARIHAITFAVLAVAFRATDFDEQGLGLSRRWVVSSRVPRIIVVIAATCRQTAAKQQQDGEKNSQTLPNDHARISLQIPRCVPVRDDTVTAPSS